MQRGSEKHKEWSVYLLKSICPSSTLHNRHEGLKVKLCTKVTIEGPVTQHTPSSAFWYLLSTSVWLPLCLGWIWSELYATFPLGTLTVTAGLRVHVVCIYIRCFSAHVNTETGTHFVRESVSTGQHGSNSSFPLNVPFNGRWFASSFIFHLIWYVNFLADD